MSNAPYGFDLHPAALIVVLFGVVAVVVAHARLARAARVPIPWTRRERWFFAGACVIGLVATAWPLADLAAHWSLTALVVQRLVLALAVAPLLLLGLPYDVIQWLTRPRVVDAVLTRVERPPVAIATVTLVLVGSMVPASVAAAASSLPVRALLDLATVAAGLVLWIPVIGRVPGIRRPKPVIRFGYLVGQAIVPAFLSVVYIFSAHAALPDVQPLEGGGRAASARRPADRRVRLEALDDLRPARSRRSGAGASAALGGRLRRRRAAWYGPTWSASSSVRPGARRVTGPGCTSPSGRHREATRNPPTDPPPRRGSG